MTSSCRRGADHPAGRQAPRGHRGQLRQPLLGLFAQTGWKGVGGQGGGDPDGAKLIEQHRLHRDQLLEAGSSRPSAERWKGPACTFPAHEHKVDWIVIKAICDWADGKKSVQKEERQEARQRRTPSVFLVESLKYAPRSAYRCRSPGADRDPAPPLSGPPQDAVPSAAGQDLSAQVELPPGGSREPARGSHPPAPNGCTRTLSRSAILCS